MKHIVLLLCLFWVINAISPVAAEDFYPDFAVVVHLPNYEAFLKNLGSSPIRVDGYGLSSPSGSFSQANWAPLELAGPEIVTALGPGADGFVRANPTSTHLTELNLFGSATWQPGQSWSIGFPFKSNDPNFNLDAVFRFTSPDGRVLTGGTVIPPRTMFPAAFIVVPEPAAMALVMASAPCVLFQYRRRSS